MKISLNDVEISYQDQGKGLPILFLHGYPLSQAMWEPQVKALSSNYRVITLDLRGHGKSEAPLWFYTMDTFVEDVRALLDQLSIDQVVLAGFSMGGYIAFAFYRKYKDRVKALVLADTRPQADTSEGKQTRFQTAQTAHSHGAEAIAGTMIPKLLTAKSLQTRPDLVQTVRKIITSIPVAGMVGDLMAMATREDSVALLSEIDCPVLILVGEQDGLTPPSDAKFIAERIKKSQLELIPEAGHLSNLEQPERFTEAVQKFLKSL
jgi:3-oxoadipate enol-lactonase